MFTLFRYSPQDQNEPKDVIIIDLQGTRFGRAGIELVYFFCSSTSPGVNFTNVLRTAFTLVDPESVKRY